MDQAKKTILVACGTSISTTAIVVETLTEELVRTRHLNVEFYKCTVADLQAQIEFLRPDVVITTAPVNPDWVEGLPYFKGMPLLTGIGADALVEEIAEEVRKQASTS